MSCSTTVAIYPNDRIEEIEEYRNSHGSAPHVWEFMARRYLGATKAYDYPNKGWMQMGSELWDLWRAPRIPEEHRAVFMWTFDRAYVGKANYGRFAEAIKGFIEDAKISSDYVNHWPAFEAFFRSDPEYPGVGLYATSVGENPFYGTWNEEKEDYDPPDWNEVYEIYEQIDGLKKDAA